MKPHAPRPPRINSTDFAARLKDLTNQTQGTFLGWHRYFTWQYEQALRNECGYKGTQPYWDWAKTAVTGLEKSPILDGSPYSMSGNGAKVANQGPIVISAPSPGLPELVIPSGSGGGCVTSGPFKDMKVNLGPVNLSLPGNQTVSNGDGLSYNPRCLKRDLTDYANKRFANASSIARTIINQDNIEDFQMTMQGVPGTDDIGIHGGGHYSMGGDPGRDLFVSPSDPFFYLHHGMIDRTWWIWQMLDAKTRTSAAGISGTGTFLNFPPSPDTTLDTVIDLGFAAGPPITMRDLMSTTDGPFCYIYL
jgi:tyrosinase